jgi:hypothetical protein
MMKLLSATFDVKKEAAYTMCNIAAHGDEFCTKLLEHGVLKAMVPLFKSTDIDTIHYALSFTEMILHSTTDGVKVFEESGGLLGLETLEYNNNELLRNQADNILDTYFYKEQPDSAENADGDDADAKADGLVDGLPEPTGEVVGCNGGSDN